MFVWIHGINNLRRFNAPFNPIPTAATNIFLITQWDSPLLALQKSGGVLLGNHQEP